MLCTYVKEKRNLFGEMSVLILIVYCTCVLAFLAGEGAG